MAAVTAAGAVMLIAGALWNGGVPGKRLYGEILRDGHVIERIPLDSPPRDIKIGTDGAFNIIRAGGGGIAIISADCPDGSCIRMGRATKPGSGAVCLPHKLSIRVRAQGSAPGVGADVDGGTW